MKKAVLILLLVVAVTVGAFLWSKRRSSSPAPVKTTVTTDQTATTPATKSDLTLALPFATTNLPNPPRAFGLYPFGIKSSEHPYGHAGFDVELTSTSSVLAPADLTIVSIDSPAGRPDEHNLVTATADGRYRLIFSRVGALQPSVKVGASFRTGEVLAVPGHNRTQNVYQFDLAIHDSQGSSLCPAESFWQPDAWQELLTLLGRSKDNSGQPYTAICYLTSPIPPAQQTGE